MRKLAVLAACTVLLGCGQKPGGSTGGGSADLATPEDKVSYIIGLQMGKSLAEQHVSVKEDLLLRGYHDGQSGSKALMTEDEIRTTMMAFQQQLMNAQRTRDSSASIDNQKEGEAFLATNHSKDGVQTTASGLQYKVIKEGSGPHPLKTSMVTVHYRGTLLNGDEFDSSYQRNEPATFPLNQVIPGWTEGLQLMTPGSKFQFWIPSALAYGEGGSPPKIGPNSTLSFEVELLSFK